MNRPIFEFVGYDGEVAVYEECCAKDSEKSENKPSNNQTQQPFQNGF